MTRRIRNYQGRNFNRKRSPDKLSRKRRSSLMSKIRSKETSFERNFISILKKETKEKFKIFVTSIKGKPDIVFFKGRVCVFLDSDFWHGWQYPRWKHLLKNDFWRSKIENNRRRDKNISSYLKNQEWEIIRLWEHEIKANPKKCLDKIIKHLTH